MRELKLGKMKTAEIHAWFGMSRNTFKKHEQEYLEELKAYCDYEIIYGGFMIKEIYKTTYINKKSQVWNFFSSKVDALVPEKQPFTSQEIADELYYTYEKEAKGYSNNYIYNIVIETRNENYGNPKYLGRCPGKYGISSYILCTRDKETGKLRFFTEEEEKVKKELMIKHFNTREDKLAILQDMVEKNEIPEKDFYQYYKQVILPKGGGYGAFFSDMKNQGILVIRGTLVERNGFMYIEEINN